MPAKHLGLPKRARKLPHNWGSRKGKDKKEREKREKGIRTELALLRGSHERGEESAP